MKRLLSKDHLILYLLTSSIFVLFLFNQYSSVLADPDSFYHMKMAQLLLDQGIIKDFIWLPYTTLSEHFVNQHLLFHVLLAPFVTWGNPFLGVKLFTALLGTTAIISIALLLRSLKLRWWLLATVILTLTVTFTFRLNLVKASPLSMILLCVVIWCLIKKRNWLLAVTSMVFVWSYGGFFLVIPVVCIWIIANAKKALWKKPGIFKNLIILIRPLLAACGGIIIGLLFNPYFPDNLYFYWEQVVQIGIINYGDSIGVGGEWYSYYPHELFIGSLWLTFIFGGALFFKIINRLKWKELDWFVLGLSIFGMLLTFKSRRYVEYFGPFTILAAATWLNELKTDSLKRLIKSDMPLRKMVMCLLLTAFLVISVVPIILHDSITNASDVREGYSITQYKDASEWLSINAVPGSNVMHSDWDDFPMLFYYNSNVNYMAGLDPTFMYRYNEDLYWMWVEITLGTYKGDLGDALSKLNVKYIFIESNHTEMYNLFNEYKKVKLIYTDEEADIFVVL
ncbi:MAG: hypothetical protein Q8P90_05270 [bacterium]|nr:hypothetical protein [bacterium]